MYSKLSIRNIKRSFKDYTIYFLTIVFAVCIFYVFNSIESQQILMDISDYQKRAFELISRIMEIASVFISFILGFLIIYANNYLIKRRKKELGIYMTLGMEKGYISKLLFIETILIGFISLGVGLGFGVLLSQGLSVVTAKMFNVDLTRFEFIFSKDAFIKTLICFGLIYLVVLLFNSISIRKIKLIDLLYANKKNEKLKVKNIAVSFIIFILSILTIGTAYYIVLKNGLAVIDNKIIVAVILGSLGTFLFFMSLSGFLLKIAQMNKRHYLKNLNMFILRQINSKINTTFISMTFICLMLFWAICTLSGGLGISTAMNSELEDLTNYDLTIYDMRNAVDIDSKLKAVGIDLNEYTDKYNLFTVYTGDIKYKDLFGDDVDKKLENLYPVATNQNASIVKLSEFNKELESLGKKTISLEDNEYALYSDINDAYSILENKITEGKEIKIGNKNFKPSPNKLIKETLYNSTIKHNVATIVVNDKYVAGLKPFNTFINLNYKGEEGEYNKKVDKAFDEKESLLNGESIYQISREQIYATAQGVSSMASYLAIYIGIVFLITSAAILALQQLSEAADNSERYRLLKKIGVEDKEINKTIFKQIGIYFLMPLSLALVHSIVGLRLIKDIVTFLGSSKVMTNVIITAIVLLVVYGGYYIATYIGAKNMVKNK